MWTASRCGTEHSSRTKSNRNLPISHPTEIVGISDIPPKVIITLTGGWRSLPYLFNMHIVFIWSGKLYFCQGKVRELWKAMSVAIVSGFVMSGFVRSILLQIMLTNRGYFYWKVYWDIFLNGSHSNQHIYHAVCVDEITNYAWVQITKFLLSQLPHLSYS